MTVTSEWDYTQERPYKGDILEEKRRIYIHLYFNAEKAAADRAILEDKITALRHELLEGKRVPEHETQYRKYFIEKETPARGRSVTVNDEAVRKARTYYGYFWMCEPTHVHTRWQSEGVLLCLPWLISTLGVPKMGHRGKGRRI